MQNTIFIINCLIDPKSKLFCDAPNENKNKSLNIHKNEKISSSQVKEDSNKSPINRKPVSEMSYFTSRHR